MLRCMQGAARLASAFQLPSVRLCAGDCSGSVRARLRSVMFGTGSGVGGIKLACRAQLCRQGEIRNFPLFVSLLLRVCYHMEFIVRHRISICFLAQLASELCRQQPQTQKMTLLELTSMDSLPSRCIKKPERIRIL